MTSKKQGFTLENIATRRAVPVVLHKAGELPDGLVEAAQAWRPQGDGWELCRLADTTCFLWCRFEGPVLRERGSSVLIEQYPKPGELVAVMG